ncbi:hypothetical protein OJAV_G00041760 [Oryzias javanicus]|uniref:MyoD family inhibitor domain-containing protein n=1 Tax=Oryzias javanicus TaxID=123683 RepID=A0A3S2MCP6_ORYJA|nr:hypothetical protein OJAV_G00041760 [Oryzias javanicus]
MKLSPNVIMDEVQNSTVLNKTKYDLSKGNAHFYDSQNSRCAVRDDSLTGRTGSMTEIDSLSEFFSTEDTELSDTSVSQNTRKSVPDDNTKRGAKSIRSSCFVEQKQPTSLHILLPSSEEGCTIPEVSQSVTAIRTQGSQKTISAHTEPDGSDLCAAVLLACLFCRPLDCLLATFRGCNGCIWSFSSFLCGCEPSALQPLQDVFQSFSLCGCPGIRSLVCDCTPCSICLQATECLDLAMEISQMLNH